MSVQAVGEPAVSYLAGGGEYNYPGLGDPTPPKGADVSLLTIGGVCIRGPWREDGSVIGWAPLPKRNHAREAALLPGVKLPR